MATLYTNIATNNVALNVQSRNDSIKTDGTIRYLTATYTCTGSEATSGDSIAIGELPIGAIVSPRDITISNDGAGGTLVITKIGDALDDDRYSASNVACSSAGIVAVTPIASALINQYQVTASSKMLYATITSASAPTAGKKVIFRIPYIIPQ